MDIDRVGLAQESIDAWADLYQKCIDGGLLATANQVLRVRWEKLELDQALADEQSGAVGKLMSWTAQVREWFKEEQDGRRDDEA